MPKVYGKKIVARHDPLAIEISQDEQLAKHGLISKPGRRNKRARKDEVGEGETLDAKTSKKILSLAQAQQDEINGEEEDGKEGSTAELLNGHEGEEEDEKEWDEDEEYEELEIDPEDLNTLERLLPEGPNTHRTLADIILEKIESSKRPDQTSSAPTIVPDGSLDPAAGLDPRIVAVYSKVGGLFQKGRYKSGPVPKVFKILPTHPEWARYLALTNPENWSPQATFEATKIFISNLKPEQARVFLEGVVLPNVRDDIQEHGGKLNVHLYNALRKGLYKPAAWFKGILFPLCKGGCTLKEASIVGSVLSRVRIPILHSAAALLRLASMDYSGEGSTSLFIRVLLDKKYALPYQVVDGLWSHFVRLANERKAPMRPGDKLPVLWHQSLLVFCQRYASDMTPDQKDALLDVVRIQYHPQIGPEIRRELVHSVARGEPRPTEDVEMRGA
ncbi:Bystin-domain-containing protein [Cantharellus anzutake]|uniref:Bystin-domain-containing protein n=1 Tax=Cantharellus anzutake TaxID=1750568 RepID=UPI001907319D|nr:Bystin-domain-containing protein [Cantharellus anzutake]KAF8338985.1 Bystin-domain-containing protein [Cantharellus anzutake]